MSDTDYQTQEENRVDWLKNQSSVKGDDAEDSKPDSGMDEDTPLTPGSESGDDEDEDEIISIKKVKKRPMIMDDDLDSEASQSSSGGAENTVFNDDSNTEVVPTNGHDNVTDSSENSDSDEEPISLKKNTSNKPLHSNPDLFDAESDDEEEEEEKADVSDKESGDEGFDEDMLTPALKAKLKKGAAKKPRVQKERKSKQKAYDTMDIHSETQRLVRESNLNVPYYEPSVKSVKDFLGKAMKKQQEYRSIRGVKNKEDRKIQVLQDMCPADSSTTSNSASMDDIDLTHSKNLPKINSEIDATQHETADQSSNDSANVSLAYSKKEVSDQETAQQTMDCDQTDSLNSVPAPSTAECDDDFLPDLAEPDDETGLLGVESVIDSDSACTKTEQDSMNIDKSVVPVLSEEVVDSEKSLDDNQNSEQEEIHRKEILEASDVTVLSQCDNETPSVRKKKKLSELINVNELPALTPTMLSGDKCVIDLDSGDYTPQSGVHKLMNRFLVHSSKTKKCKPKTDVDLSIVEKVADKDELKMTKLTYHTDEQNEEDNGKKLEAPGAKLVALKENLFVKMKQRRSEQRQKRVEIYELENEEGFQEEEEELTDNSDTDLSEDEEFEEQFGKEEDEVDDDEEEEVELADKPRPTSEFIDGEADEDDSDGGSDEDNEDEDDEIGTNIDGNEEENMNLRLDFSDEEEEEGEAPACIQRSLEKKKSKKLCISEDEDTRDVDASQEKTESEMKPASVEEDFLSPFSKQLSNPAGQVIQKVKKVSSFNYPVEDSQCLYDNTEEASPIHAVQSFTDDSQSQMLDDDGFLKASKSSTKKSSALMLGKNKSEDMEELLGLCSGQFPETQDDEKKSTNRSLFGALQTGTQANMDELLGLCSGNFASETTQKKGIKRKSPIDDDEETNDSFQILSDADDEGGFKAEKNMLSDDDTDVNMDADESDEEEVAEAKRPFASVSFKNKFGKIRQQFVEEEAELSGSEYDSDENLDLALEDDILEEEEGDNDVKISDSALRNQVGRVHLKQLIDDDKRELMLLQEKYLTDGDLHAEGGGRTRSFKWRDMDNGSQEMFRNESDEEIEEEEEQNNEFKWRMERYEREKFLAEQKEKEEEPVEDSQFVKFSKGFLRKKDSSFMLSSQNTAVAQPKNVSEDKDLKKLNNLVRVGKKGSFLSRGKEALSKIAERTKSSVNPDAPTNSRNFVFTMLSPEKEKDAVDKPAVKRSKSLQPAAKKPRLEARSSSIPKNSIFNML